MSLAKQRLMRDQRNHLIDLLGLGATYPLQDLPLYLPAEPYLVTYENPARIGIDTSQPIVLYQLHENRKLVERAADGTQGVGIAVEQPGNEGRIQLLSYNIKDDKLFEIYAIQFTYRFALSDMSIVDELNRGRGFSKLRTQFKEIGEITLARQIKVSVAETMLVEERDRIRNQSSMTWLLQDGADASTSKRFLIRQMNDILAIYAMTDRAVYLHQIADVKVGLDTSLKAWITDAPFLDVFQPAQPPTAARLIAYAGCVTVEIENSQEGVYYRLIAGKLNADGTYPLASPPNQDVRLSEEDDEGTGLGKLGTGENITLQTITIQEDIDIRIRATKTFPGTNRQNETVLLAVTLPLRVRANPALTVKVTSDAIINYNAKPQLTINNTQTSAAYRAYSRPIPDDEFRAGLTITPILTVNVLNEEPARIPDPLRSYPHLDSPNYAMVGAASLAGTGGDLALQLDALLRDSVFIVHAEKQHLLATFDQQVQNPRRIASEIWLRQAVLVLVRPNPDQALRFRVNIENNQTDGELAVFDGQPGVFYEFRTAPNATPMDFPAYFYQVNEVDLSQNRGIDSLAVRVDFVVARNPDTPVISNLAQTPAAFPILDTGVIAANTTLHIQAIRAQTRVRSTLSKTLLIAALPEILAEESIINYNAETRLLVNGSIVGERYQPFLNGEVFKQARNGNGEQLVFKTDKLSEDTTYEMVITATDTTHLELTRIVVLTIRVRPNPALVFAPLESSIKAGTSTNILLEASQIAVQYQLFIPGTPPTMLGTVVSGTGDTITLPTGNLNQTTQFGIRATKLKHPAIGVDLAQTVTVQVTN